MEVLHVTSRKRETYEVQFAYSPLWECALGIAAITNSRLIETLERSTTYWRELKGSFPDDYLHHLEYVEKNNTWKALLQLLHQKNYNNLEEFCSSIKLLQDVNFKFICLPFIGNEFQQIRKSAALGEESAISELKRVTSENPFFPQYIEFIGTSNVDKLKDHLIEVMTGWYEMVITPNIEQTCQILQTDYESKNKMKVKMSPEELVHWTTGGVNYPPEPSVHKVLCIPQYVYRPWNIEADIEDTKVFYYPVANESLSPNDKYMPNHSLVQKHKALGDEIRLRIVKLLSEDDRTLQEVTDQLNMGKTTIHHHLKILRGAKIVEMKGTKYSLNANVLGILFKELDQYIKQ
ncbi:ArsR/SmtB family transcription factor [Halalkalibacter okhensis]|uniref:ArsR family transcriptional regulator n=1 Tax=Halalkalibacter okhensis TaxID=333138 RepID=A0A0B0ICD4_9BACI|nr:metalloregulator ArsR/SmtB family transcription factor [Halalkalibacter okhensis]KHF38935.1 ArsR family transcriptional regulator [Halalkalibacter okhensis]